MLAWDMVTTRDMVYALNAVNLNLKLYFESVWACMPVLEMQMAWEHAVTLCALALVCSLMLCYVARKLAALVLVGTLVVVSLEHSLLPLLSLMTLAAWWLFFHRVLVRTN